MNNTFIDELMFDAIKTYRRECCNDHDPKNIRTLRGLLNVDIEETIKRIVISTVEAVCDKARERFDKDRHGNVEVWEIIEDIAAIKQQCKDNNEGKYEN